MKVIVLGGGVIGIATSYFLASSGYEVTVIEKNPDVAMGCSQANGGQLSYSHIDTWAEKNSFTSLIKAAFTPGSFLTFSGLGGKGFVSWAKEFYQNSKPQNAIANAQKLFELSSRSKDALEYILNRENIEFSYKKEGTLHFFRNEKKLDSAIRKFKNYPFLAGKVKILTPEECVKKEPTLVRLLDERKLAGGIFYEEDASGDCALFTKKLAEICSKKYKVIFKNNVTIKNILNNGTKITGINTNKGVMSADNYICAMGVGGAKLLDGIGIPTKIYPIKGYSLSIAANDEFIAPKIALTDNENKIVYSRLGNIFRAAGTIEIAGFNAKLNQKNISFLSKIIHQTFSDCGNFNQVVEWTGFRPFRPDSKPLICKSEKYNNLFLNIGHGSLGWTLAAGSGKVVCDLLDGNVS
jgi:D-amino-acid dehydrogenase